jgi:hypothetical protein
VVFVVVERFVSVVGIVEACRGAWSPGRRALPCRAGAAV